MIHEGIYDSFSVGLFSVSFPISSIPDYMEMLQCRWEKDLNDLEVKESKDHTDNIMSF